MIRALLIRHAQSTWNADGRAQGWLDAPLSPYGIAEATHLADEAVLGGFHSVVSSDLERARHTAGLLAHGLGLAPPTTDARLRERELGWWAGHVAAETAARWPAELSDWRDYRLECPPGGESTASVVRRVTAGLVDIARKSPDASPLLVVSHGGVISALERSADSDGQGGSGGRTDRARAAGQTDMARPAGHSNLSGRWLVIGAGRLILGEPFVPNPSEPDVGGTLETT